MTPLPHDPELAPYHFVDVGFILKWFCIQCSIFTVVMILTDLAYQAVKSKLKKEGKAEKDYTPFELVVMELGDAPANIGYQCSSMVPNGYLTFIGLMSLNNMHLNFWRYLFVPFGLVWKATTTTVNKDVDFDFNYRMHGYVDYPYGGELAGLQFCMNLYNLVIMGVIYVCAEICDFRRFKKCNGLLTVPMFVHHIFTGYMGLQNIMPHPCHWHSAPFYGGLIESTNIPLGVMDAMKSTKSLPTVFPKFYFYVRLVFALGFVWLRLVMWTCFNVPMFYDQSRYFLLATDSVWLLEYVPGFVPLLFSPRDLLVPVKHHWTAPLFNIISIGLVTFLQYKWGYVVVLSLTKAVAPAWVYEALFGGGAKKAKKE